MFDALSNAMLPKAKKSKQTQPKNPNKTAESTITHDVSALQDVQNSLPTFQLNPINDFHTTDDDILANLVYDVPQTMTETNKENSLQTVLPAMPLAASNQRNTQVKNHNMNNPQFNFPMLLQMYFQNSSVTINYNFGK